MDGPSVTGMTYVEVIQSGRSDLEYRLDIMNIKRIVTSNYIVLSAKEEVELKNIFDKYE